MMQEIMFEYGLWELNSDHPSQLKISQITSVVWLLISKGLKCDKKIWMELTYIIIAYLSIYHMINYIILIYY